MNHAARGARAENQVAGELGELGYDVIRSAASKGAADLVAVHDGEILFVQVKLVPDGKGYVQPTPAERRELYRVAARVGGIPVIAMRHPGAGSRKPLTRLYLMTGTGPEDRIDFLPRETP